MLDEEARTRHLVTMGGLVFVADAVGWRMTTG